MVIVGEYREIKYDFISEQVGSFHYGKWYEILKCQGCDEVELRVHSYHQGFDEIEFPTEYTTLYPAAQTIPEGLPTKVKKEYVQALKARHGDLNGYGVLLGRVLESVFHDKKAKGRMLGDQLQDMANRKQLPAEALAFAHSLNKLRVVGAHFNVGKLTPKEIPIMETLTKVILEYVYSTPFIIKRAEKAINKLDGKKDKSPNKPVLGNVLSTKLPVPICRKIVKTIPLGVFNGISIEMPNWQQTFMDFIRLHLRIKYDVYSMPNLGADITKELRTNGYTMLIYENDQDQRFLVPRSS